jgi:tyrosyl-tRNA synthetase
MAKKRTNVSRQRAYKERRKVRAEATEDKVRELADGRIKEVATELAQERTDEIAGEHANDVAKEAATELAQERTDEIAGEHADDVAKEAAEEAYKEAWRITRRNLSARTKALDDDVNPGGMPGQGSA